MGDFNRNGQLFIVMNDGSFRTLESVAISTDVENCYEFDKCCCGFNVCATGVIKNRITIKGYGTSTDTIDTDFLVAARDNLNKIIEERKRKEAEEARKKLEEETSKLVNRFRILNGLKPVKIETTLDLTNYQTADIEFTKRMLKHELNSVYGCSIFTSDVTSPRYVTLNMARSSGKSMMNLKNYVDNEISKAILGTSKLPKIDPKK